MFAIIRSGSNQYRVVPGDTIYVDLLDKNDGDKVIFEDVLMVKGDAGIMVGKPILSNVSVTGEVIKGEVKDEKLIIFRYKRRKNCRVKAGHRQRHCQVKITDIKIKTKEPSSEKVEE